MTAQVQQVDILLTESESGKRWRAWFSVLYSDSSVRSWDVEIPAQATWVSAGVPDWAWIATLLKVITDRQPEDTDIVVTSGGSGHVRVELHGDRLDLGVGSEFRSIRELEGETEIPGQLPLFGEVSRETNA